MLLTRGIASAASGPLVSRNGGWHGCCLRVRAPDVNLSSCSTAPPATEVAMIPLTRILLIAILLAASTPAVRASEELGFEGLEARESRERPRRLTWQAFQAGVGAEDLADPGPYAADALGLIDELKALGPRPGPRAVIDRLTALSTYEPGSRSTGGRRIATEQDSVEGWLWVRTDRTLSLIERLGDRGRVLGYDTALLLSGGVPVLREMNRLTFDPDPPEWARDFVRRSATHDHVENRVFRTAGSYENVRERLWAGFEGRLWGLIKPQVAWIQVFEFPLWEGDPGLGTFTVSALSKASTGEGNTIFRSFVAEVAGGRGPEDIDLSTLALRRLYRVEVLLPVEGGALMAVGREYFEANQKYGRWWKRVFDPVRAAGKLRRWLDFAGAIRAHGGVRHLHGGHPVPSSD